MIEQGMLEIFIDYGTMGLFIAYLIYDRQFLMRRVVQTLEKLTAVIQELDKDIIGNNGK